MEHSIQIETGAQLLARLIRRPSVEGLNEILFTTGPRPNEVVEISGDLSSGKTLLTTQLLVKCLLPKRYKNFDLKGLGAGAILVNTDHHFHIAMLVDLMKNFLRKLTTDNKSKRQLLEDNIVASIVENSLSSLTVVNCYNSAQFLLGLQSLQTILANDDKIALVAVDSVSAFYWEERDNGGTWSMDGSLKSYLRQMQKYTVNHKVVLIYTRPTEFQSRGKEIADCAEKVNYRIKLHRLEKTGEFDAIVESVTDKKTISYKITDHGIKWRIEE